MGDRRRGRPRKDDSINGGVHDYAILLALIWKADGNVTKAAMNLGHEGTKSFYNAIRRLRNHINGDILKNAPHYDRLYAYDKNSQMPTWTENGLKLVKMGDELFRTKKRYDDEEEKTRLRNAHFEKCKTPLYPHTEILVTTPENQSRFQIIYACRFCTMMMRNFITVEFTKWRNDHLELYSTCNRAFIEIR